MSSRGTVKKDISLKLIPLYFDVFMIINNNIVIIIVDAITDSIADNVFLFIPLANIRDKIENRIISIIHKNNRFAPLNYSDNPI